jgi:hypothetical protein
MKRIWNTFCEDISRNKGVKEIVFEKEIVKSFLQALGWSRYDRNLEEQYALYSRKWIPDFVFYLNNDKNAKEIILELKKPDHRQRKVDIEQIEAYMKLTDCRFGLYFGEKLEVFYLEEREGKRSAASVTTIEWTIDNEEGANLIELLNFRNYDRRNLEQFCSDHLYLNSFLRLWETQRGRKHLYDGIMEHFMLPASMAGSLQSHLKFTICDSSEVEEYNAILQVSEISESVLTNSQDSHPRLFNLPTLPAYLNNLKSDLTREVMNSMGIKTDISEITDLEKLELLKKEVKKVERIRNIHHTHSCAISKYIEYVKAGLKFRDLEFDANLVKRTKKSTISRKLKQPKSEASHNDGKQRPPFEFSMAGLSRGDRISFIPTGVEVMVEDNKRVSYNGSLFTLTAFCKAFLPNNMRNNSEAYQGSKYFSYQGKTLVELRLEKENNNENKSR